MAAAREDPRAARPVEARPDDMKPRKPQLVLIQLQIEPAAAKPVITVDGARKEKNYFKVQKSDAKEIEIKVEAKGYKTWSRKILPGFSQNIPVTLKSTAPRTTPRKGRRRRGRKKFGITDVL